MDPTHTEELDSAGEPVLLEDAALEEVEEIDNHSSGSQDFYTSPQADLGSEDERNEGEEYYGQEDTQEQLSSTPPGHSETVAHQEAPLTPKATPFSWKDAAKSTPEILKEAGQPSFTDKAMMDQVELNAKQSAANLVVLVHHLRTQLASISTLSVQYMSLHKMAVEGTAEHIHDGIASTQKLIIKAQALNSELRKVHVVQQDIKETKKLLSQLEKAVEKMTKS